MKKLIFLTLALLLGPMGCGSIKNQTIQSYREHLQSKRWHKALKLAKDHKLSGSQKSKLIQWLELGMIQHLRGKYFQSQKYWDQARELSNELFTVSLSKKALTVVGSDSLDDFYGEIYERSMLRFYSALNHYLIYQQGYYESYKRDGQAVPQKVLSLQERRRHLEAARAMIVEWNSKIQEWRDERAGQTVYKDDLMAKTFGAFIHEQIGIQTDQNIAQLLYKDAQRVLFQNYNVYPTFNVHYKKFKKDFKKLPQLSKKEVTKSYVSATTRAKNLKAYLQKREKSLAQRKRPNVTIVIHHGLVARKRPRIYRFPLDFASSIKTTLTGEMSMMDFTIQVLGLASEGDIPAIEFELPHIPTKEVTTDFNVQLFQGDKQIASHPIWPINPLSDIAKEALEERALSTRLRLGVRLIAKHVAAITSVYGVYMASLQKGTPRPIAQWLATGLYLAASRGIASSERADLRSWYSLPHTLSMTSFFLPPGTYQVKLLKNHRGKKTVHPLLELDIQKEESQLISQRVF